MVMHEFDDLAHCSPDISSASHHTNISNMRSYTTNASLALLALAASTFPFALSAPPPHGKFSKEIYLLSLKALRDN
jgi:hypothetical protein